MAPEQARGGAITPASDVFALGLVLFEMMTGRRAINGDNVLETLLNVDRVDPDSLAVQTPAPFDTILRRALVRDTLRRRTTMAEVAEELTSHLLSTLTEKRRTNNED
jgi:serine/threonine-protein kinase